MVLPVAWRPCSHASALSPLRPPAAPPTLVRGRTHLSCRRISLSAQEHSAPYLNSGERVKSLVVSLATALAVLSPGALSVPAHAAESYVTKAEFKRAEIGMKKARVHKIFDIKGKQLYYSSASEWCSRADLWACATQTREYRTKSKWGYVSIYYTQYPNGIWRLDSKHAYWG